MSKIKLDLPVLFDRSKAGKTKQWKIWVEQEPKAPVASHTMPASIIIEHGYIDGKKQTQTEVITEGKNIGRSNETTPYDQACSEAKSAWQKKKDKGYVESLDHAQTKKVELLPMLAHKFAERAHHVSFPCYVQPKLNGFRCLASCKDGTVTFTSRGGETFANLAHIEAILSHVDGEVILDGELYIHGVSLQKISSAVNKPNELTPHIEYWVYDIADPTLSFEERTNKLAKIVKKLGMPTVRYVHTIECESVEEVHAAHKSFAKEYEGTMIRNRAGKYLLKHRSNDLQKLKDFVDEEFKIIGVEQDVRGFAVFKCVTKAGKVFDVVKEGGFEEKRADYLNREQHTGKGLTVRFQNYSDDGVPIFPVGVIVREKWDQS